LRGAFLSDEAISRKMDYFAQSARNDSHL